MRVLVEDATGFGSGEHQVAGVAHMFFDVTEEPALTVMAGRPVLVALTEGPPR